MKLIAHAVSLVLALLALDRFAPEASAITGPENVAVIVNADSWASMRLANEYIHLRRIPAANVIYLEGIPSFERIGVDVFRERILQPILKTLDERGLGGQIDAVVYSADFPTTIDVRADIGNRKLPQVLTPEAAINGLTFLYPFVLAKDIRYLDFNANLYARRVTRPNRDTPWTEADQQRYATVSQTLQAVNRRRRERERQERDRAAKPTPGAPAAKPSDSKPDVAKPSDSKPDSPKTTDSKPNDAKPNETQPTSTPPPSDDEQSEREDLAAALETLEALRAAHPQSADLLYNLACVEAVLGRHAGALKTLTAAVDNGWIDARHTANDSDWKDLREHADFQKQLERMRSAPLVMQPPRRFRGSVGWSGEGEPGPVTVGPRYLASTMLAYTSGRGLSVSESLEQLRRSTAADQTRPQGTVYFPFNSDVRSTTREWAFRAAAAELEKLGVRAVVEPGVLPQGKTDVAGAVLGTAGFDWKASGSRILPGAICEHLTSFGGILTAEAGQTPLTELLRAGAAGASGTVTEPYAIQAKFPTPFIQVAYVHGLTLGEAFYQSVTGPYQLLIVGDLLCRPWGRSVELRLGGVPEQSELRGSVRLTAGLADASQATPAAQFELFVDGRRWGPPTMTPEWEIDTKKLADGPHEFECLVEDGPGVATLGRVRRTITVANGSTQLTSAPFEKRPVPWNQSIELTAQLPGARDIVWRHNGRDVARVEGPQGTVKIDPRSLGAGPVRLLPVGRVEEREVWGAPVELEIAPPPARSPVSAPEAVTWVQGLKLVVGDRPATVVERTNGDWLAKAGVTADTTWTLEAWFDVPATDVVQWQWEGNASIERIVINDEPVEWPQRRPWSYVPVSLKAGLHRVRIEGRGAANPRLDLRFGGSGTRWLDANRFRHPS